MELRLRLEDVQTGAIGAPAASLGPGVRGEEEEDGEEEENGEEEED